MARYTPPVRTLRDVLVDAERRLAIAGVPSPRVDAELLLAHVLDVPRGRLLMSDPADPSDTVRFEALLVKRVARVPLQHLLGEAPFRHLTLAVGRGVFVPRPETESVAELAIRALREAPEGSRLAVDLCTGSGAIALAVATEVRGSVVHAVELDEAAAAWARRNIEENAGAVTAAGSTVELHVGDATLAHLESLEALVGRFDLVVTNPPYIPDAAVPRDAEVAQHDPPRALFGGPDGLDVVRGLVVAAAALLRPGGVLVVEHGDEQGERAGAGGVPHVLREHGGFTTVVDHVDLGGRDRATTARRV
jgi:release factor glutamine methyltransferase